MTPSISWVHGGPEFAMAAVPGTAAWKSVASLDIGVHHVTVGIGAWPEHGIEGTQLGPIKNGRHM